MLERYLLKSSDERILDHPPDLEIGAVVWCAAAAGCSALHRWTPGRHPRRRESRRGSWSCRIDLASASCFKKESAQTGRNQEAVMALASSDEFRETSQRRQSRFSMYESRNTMALKGAGWVKFTSADGSTIWHHYERGTYG